MDEFNLTIILPKTILCNISRKKRENTCLVGGADPLLPDDGLFLFLKKSVYYN